jgi:hypothetical protein
MDADHYRRRTAEGFKALLQRNRISVPKFAVRLQRHAPGGDDSEPTVRRWLAPPGAKTRSDMPLWAALAAAELLDASLDEVFGVKGDPSLRAEVEQLKGEVHDLRQMVVEHAETLAHAWGKSPSVQDKSPPA